MKLFEPLPETTLEGVKILSVLGEIHTLPDNTSVEDFTKARLIIETLPLLDIYKKAVIGAYGFEIETARGFIQVLYDSLDFSLDKYKLAGQVADIADKLVSRGEGVEKLDG